MRECPFPVHFIQFDVAMYKGFFFKLPEHIIGREDVTVYVDYCPIGEDGKQVYVGVWAQIEGIPPAKYRFYHLTLPVKSLEKDETQTIISALNESPNFIETLEQYLSWADENLPRL